MPVHVRAYIYRIATVAAAILVFYGLMSQREAGLWLMAAGAVLAIGEGTLAAVHTPTRRDETDAVE